MSNYNIRYPVVAAGILGCAAGFVGAKWIALDSDTPPARVARSSAPAEMATSKGAAKATVQVAGRETDMARALKSRAEGVYVLDFDIAEMQQRNLAQEQMILQRLRETRDKEYEDLFSSLGLDETSRGQLRGHLEQISRSKIQAAQYLTQLLNATMAFDERVEKLLGASYQVYKAEELAYSGRREFQELQKTATARGLALEPGDKAKIEQLIQQSGAYSFPTLSDWSGPYQTLLAPFGGKDYVPTVQGMMAKLERQAAAVVVEARATGLGESAIAALQAHYDNQIGQMGRLIEGALDPRKVYMENLSRRLADLKANPQANAQAIAKLERSLTGLQRAQEAKK